MSKWSEDFIVKYGETSTLKRLTRDIKNADSKKLGEKNMDRVISEIIKGKYKRRCKK